MAIIGLDKAQAFAFIGEMTSTRNLLAYGIRVLRSARFIETTMDPIMTMLSIGVEKHLKLTLGVVSLADTGEWPSKRTMQIEYGHGIAAMFDVLLPMLQARTADKSDFVRGHVQSLVDDPVLRPLLAALDRYARAGRFYNLDLLADEPQKEIAPKEMWQAVELAALDDPDVDALFKATMADISDSAAWDTFHSALLGRIAASIERLWETISWVGINHALGETGAVLGWEVRPDAVGNQ